jgi:peptidyl-tRNA hydrolase, PTH1 family
VRVVIGIGNPGSRYSMNRHNAGFLLLDFFAQKNLLSFKASTGDYYYVQSNLKSFDYLLVKPSRYVNNSGLAALQIVQKYNPDIKDILVAVDDVNLPVGEIRVRESGGDGGHNGINSIIYHLDSDQFPRIRIGVGSDFEKGKMAEYVLTDFSKEEFIILEKTFQTGADLISEFIHGGIKQMLDYNSRLPGNT